MSNNIDELYLQQLLRAVNHDVSAALRSSVGFSQIILSEYGHQLDEKVKEWLSLTIAQGEVSQAALIALSQYARLYAVQEEVSRCNLSALAQACRQSLNAGDQMQIDIQLSTSISGQKSLWEDYFKQIIGNSVRHANASLCRITEQTSNGLFKLFIEDNGSSLDEKNMADMLLPFRTLRKGSGVGMGLARAKRIVEIHGGQFSLYPSQLGFCVEASFPEDIASGVTLIS